MTFKETKPDRGNILFLILLAVVLFAALAYAVTSSLRGGGKDAGSEKAQSYASDIIGYATLVEQSVQRMMLVGDVPFNKLNLYMYAANGAYGNNTNCSNSSCKVFDPAGGGVTPRNAPSGAYYPQSRKSVSFVRVKIPNVGTDLDDLVMGFFDINEETCKQINNILGVSNNNNGLPPNATWDGGVNWLGDMSSFTELATPTFTNTAVIGKTSFCARQSYSLTPAGVTNSESGYTLTPGNSPMYYYIHVLVAR